MPKPRTVPHASSLYDVNISELCIDPEAQRELRQQWVDAHTNDFDADQLGYIVVSRRDGKFFVIDGQHRVALLRAVGWGDQVIKCECFNGLSQAEEAELFLARNDRIAVGGFDKFRVAIKAGEEAPADIERILIHQGLRLSNKGLDGHVSCVVALQKVYAGSGIASPKEGPAALARTLRTILQAWGVQPSGFQGQIIHGLGMVQLRYNGRLDQEVLVSKLAPVRGGASGLLGRAKGLKELRSRPLHHCVAAVIVDTYNLGRRTGKVDDWWA